VRSSQGPEEQGELGKFSQSYDVTHAILRFPMAALSNTILAGTRSIRSCSLLFSLKIQIDCSFKIRRFALLSVDIDHVAVTTKHARR
jgi:hypothetical protein